MARKTYVFCLFSAIFLFPLSSNVQAEQVRDYERLRLLQQATGETPAGNNSFEARLNALLDVNSNATPAYQSQAALDTQESMKEQRKLAEDAAEDAKYRSRALALSAQPQPSPSPKAGVQGGQSQTGRLPVYAENTLESTSQINNSQIDAGEDTFQRLVREEDAKRKEYAELKKQEAAKAKTLDDAIADRPKIAPSLANNPFYVKGASDTAKKQDDFDSRRALIVSRLVANGYSNFRAEQLVSEASTPEEMILVIMNEGQTYGEATEMVSAEF